MANYMSQGTVIKTPRKTVVFEDDLCESCKKGRVKSAVDEHTQAIQKSPIVKSAAVSGRGAADSGRGAADSGRSAKESGRGVAESGRGAAEEKVEHEGKFTLLVEKDEESNEFGVTIKDCGSGYPVITAVTPDSYASKSGLAVGDNVITVNGINTGNMKLGDINAKIKSVFTDGHVYLGICRLPPNQQLNDQHMENLLFQERAQAGNNTACTQVKSVTDNTAVTAVQTTQPVANTPKQPVASVPVATTQSTVETAKPVSRIPVPKKLVTCKQVSHQPVAGQPVASQPLQRKPAPIGQVNYQGARNALTTRSAAVGRPSPSPDRPRSSYMTSSPSSMTSTPSSTSGVTMTTAMTSPTLPRAAVQEVRAMPEIEKVESTSIARGPGLAEWRALLEKHKRETYRTELDNATIRDLWNRYIKTSDMDDVLKEVNKFSIDKAHNCRESVAQTDGNDSLDRHLTLVGHKLKRSADTYNNHVICGCCVQAIGTEASIHLDNTNFTYHQTCFICKHCDNALLDKATLLFNVFVVDGYPYCDVCIKKMNMIKIGKPKKVQLKTSV